MTTDTIQGNKLIAEFMGVKVYQKKDGELRVLARNNRDYMLKLWAKYHSSWDHLMPVVEKISLMNYPDEPTFADDEDYVPDTAYPRTFGMISRNGQFMVRFNRQPLFEADTLIEAAWMAVVDFVKTYNELKMSHESPHSNSPHF
jgi:hypothetical protein